MPEIRVTGATGARAFQIGRLLWWYLNPGEPFAQHEMCHARRSSSPSTHLVASAFVDFCRLARFGERGELMCRGRDSWSPFHRTLPGRPEVLRGRGRFFWERQLVPSLGDLILSLPRAA